MAERHEGYFFGLGLAVGVLIGFMLLIFLWTVAEHTYSDGVGETRQKALDADAAHWVIDAKTGERTFTWGE